jgi:acyl carrier protein
MTAIVKRTSAVRDRGTADDVALWIIWLANRSTILYSFWAADLNRNNLDNARKYLVAADATLYRPFGPCHRCGLTSRFGLTSVTALHQIIFEVFRVPLDTITPDMAIHQVSTWNSLTHIEFVVSIEEKFHIQLTADEIVAMTSVGEAERILRVRGIPS